MIQAKYKIDQKIRVISCIDEIEEWCFKTFLDAIRVNAQYDYTI
jgi:hypothetical protein